MWLVASAVDHSDFDGVVAGIAVDVGTVAVDTACIVAAAVAGVELAADFVAAAVAGVALAADFVAAVDTASIVAAAVAGVALGAGFVAAVDTVAVDCTEALAFVAGAVFFVVAAGTDIAVLAVGQMTAVERTMVGERYYAWIQATSGIAAVHLPHCHHYQYFHC